jgi:hypothetical protein
VACSGIADCTGSRPHDGIEIVSNTTPLRFATHWQFALYGLYWIAN